MKPSNRLTVGLQIVLEQAPKRSANDLYNGTVLTPPDLSGR